MYAYTVYAYTKGRQPFMAEEPFGLDSLRKENNESRYMVSSKALSKKKERSSSSISGKKPTWFTSSSNVLRKQAKVLIFDQWQRSEFQHTLACFKKRQESRRKGQKSHMRLRSCRLPTPDLCIHLVNNTGQQKKTFCQQEKEVKLRALGLKMHLVWPNWLYFWRYFYFYFFIILLEHGAFSSMRSFFNVILLVPRSKFSVHLLHTTNMYIDSYKNKP